MPARARADRSTTHRRSHVPNRDHPARQDERRDWYEVTQDEFGGGRRADQNRDRNSGQQQDFPHVRHSHPPAREHRQEKPERYEDHQASQQPTRCVHDAVVRAQQSRGLVNARLDLGEEGPLDARVELHEIA
jgi:hypothetical protein